MAFTLDILAQELGIDPETLKSKADVTAKWNGYLSQADTQYREARETLERAEREQKAIDEEIRKFGFSEARVTELEASNAAYVAALAEAKRAGLNINVPAAAAHTPADPAKSMQDTMRTGFAQMGAAMKVQTRYQAVFGKPFIDDPVKLVDEAIAARMPVEQYAEQKYKFSEEQEKQKHADLQRKIDEGVQAGVKKYREDHPITAGNSNFAQPLASRYPQVHKSRSREDKKDFRKLSPRDRIAASVSRVRETLAASAE